MKWKEGKRDMKTCKWLAMCMAAVLVLLTGCQSIGGLDVTKVMKKQLDINSYEAQQTMSIHFEPASGKLRDDDTAMMKAFNDAQLTVQVKAQDAQRISMSGKLKVASDEVPFTIGWKDNRMALKLEGAKSPIVISNDMNTQLLSTVQPASKQLKAFTESTITLFGKHAPNPQNASVKQVTEQIMGQSLPLSQLHIEFGGNELVPWVKQLLQSALKDEEGMKAWFMEMGKWYVPMLTAALSQAAPEMEGEVPDMLKDGEAFGLSAYKMFKEQLPSIISQLDQGYEAWVKSNPDAAVLLGPDTKLVLDLYADQESNIRKLNASLAIAVPASAGAPFKKVTINQSTEYSNLNGNVKVDDVDFSSSVSLTDPEMTPGKWLRHFDPSSVAHKWLKQVGVTKKWTTIPVSTTNYDDWFYDDMALPYTKSGTMMVPLRFITEEFDAKLKWEGKTKLTITDDITGAVAELTMNSKQAKVGGQTLVMPLAPEVKDGQLYVPLRSLSQMLGFTFTINKHDGSQWLELNRE